MPHGRRDDRGGAPAMACARGPQPAFRGGSAGTAGNRQDLVLPRGAVGFGSAAARDGLGRAGGGGSQTSGLPSRMALFSPPTW